MKYYKSIKVLLAIAFALPLFLCGHLAAGDNASVIARGGEGARMHHPEAGRYGGAGHHVNHPEARAAGRGYEAGAAVGGAAGAGGVAAPVYYGPTDGTTVSQPVAQPPIIINNPSQ